MCYNLNVERLSDTINEIYKKYLPIVQKHGVTLNLDFPDTTITIHEKSEKERLKKTIDKALKSAAERTKSGCINITVRPKKIIISDSGTTLSKSACEMLSGKYIEVRSRVGFGTTVTISATPQE